MMADAAQDDDPSDDVQSEHPEASPARPSGRYVAVIYCHGMGSQRRFEETSRLIDALDRYGRGSRAGRISGIEAKVELCRSAPDETVGYVRSNWSRKIDDKFGDFKTVRFYEIYWAPIMAGQKSPWRVLRWIVSQVRRPMKTVISPWRERQRLRRATLARMFERGQPAPKGALPGDFATLARAYDSYEGLAAQRAQRSGGFNGFLEEIGKLKKNAPDAVKRLHRIAKAWRRRYVLEEVRNAFVLATMALAGLLIFAGLMWLILALIQWFSMDARLGDMIETVIGEDKNRLKTASSIVIGLFALLGVGRFLTDAMGDVEGWSTYQETDEKHESRQKIKGAAIRIIKHVLADDKACDRVIMISHSLGTTIANDSLLSLAQMNRAVNSRSVMTGPPDLNKIEHFVTFGSPIDKVEYFFESYSSQSHRYKRVAEEFRGDIGTEPFTKNRTPYIHWVNFWDAGDAISGALQSPTNPMRVDARVDNVHVRNRHFPDPAGSHVGYLDNRTVVSQLFDMIYRRSASYKALPSIPGSGKDFDSVALGPGSAPPVAFRLFQALALALPWSAILAVICTRLGVTPWMAAAPATAIAATLLIGYLVDRFRPPFDPIPDEPAGAP